MTTPITVRKLLAAYPPDVRNLALAARRLVMPAAPQPAERVDSSANVIGCRYGPGYKQLIFTLMLSQGGPKIGGGIAGLISLGHFQVQSYARDSKRTVPGRSYAWLVASGHSPAESRRWK